MRLHLWLSLTYTLSWLVEPAPAGEDVRILAAMICPDGPGGLRTDCTTVYLVPGY